MNKSHWLFKEEPTHYSFSDLQKDGKANWTGVKNNLALIYLRQVRKNDLIFYYHTGKEKSIVGIAQSLNDAQKKGTEASVEIAPLKPLSSPVSLSRLKMEKKFVNSPLLRISRLSVMPITKEQWDCVLAISEQL